MVFIKTKLESDQRNLAMLLDNTDEQGKANSH